MSSTARHWRGVTLLISLTTLIPLGVIVTSFASPDPQIWDHLRTYLLPDLLANSALLGSMVALGVLLLGVPLAWLTSVYQFPGRKLFDWALMLPLAVPAYVMAFSQQGLFEYLGPLQTLLRTQFGDDFRMPDLGNTLPVALVMSLAFYPYVYLLARNAFASQGRRALEAGQSLGLSRTQGFWRIALPMARPWILGGLTLALMETFGDFGTVAIFNYDTFTHAIYKAWFALFSLPTALQLASLLVVLVLGLIALEHYSRGKRSYAANARPAPPLPRLPLSGWRGWSASLLAALVMLFAFILPIGQLLWWSRSQWGDALDAGLLDYAYQTVLLSGMAAALTAVVALLLAYAQRRDHHPLNRWLGQIATLGYAVPGTVLAVGIFVPVAWLDHQLLAWLPEGSTGLFKGTLLVMLLAYLARFLAVGHSALDSAMQRITPSQDEAARLLGLSGWKLLRRVHLPQLKGGIATALLMVFVEVMKEMPITLMTRPFDWDTLAVRIFNFTSEGQWDAAALPALTIVLAGLLPVMLLARDKENHR